jgi:hypothetical protein
MYKVHGYLDNEMVINRRMEHLPRKGDTMRLKYYGVEKYATVTEVIWCIDEDSPEGQRINLRIESEIQAP